MSGTGRVQDAHTQLPLSTYAASALSNTQGALLLPVLASTQPHLCSMHAASKGGPRPSSCCCCQRAAAAGVHKAALRGQVAAACPHDRTKGTTALLAACRQAAAAAAAAEQRCCLRAAAVHWVAVAACRSDTHERQASVQGDLYCTVGGLLQQLRHMPLIQSTATTQLSQKSYGPCRCRSEA
jgi:hypothetical protein